MLVDSFSISPVDLVSLKRSDPARSTKLILPCRMCPKSGSCSMASSPGQHFALAPYLHHSVYGDTSMSHPCVLLREQSAATSARAISLWLMGNSEHT